MALSVSHLPRLFKVLSTIAKYRLDQLEVVKPASPLLRVAIATYGLAWSGNAVRSLSPEKRLRLALEELGPIYIKFGQLLSTRRDFLPETLAEELQGLQDKVPALHTPGIAMLADAALGHPWQQVFSELNPEPLASASVAQVHSATLLNGDAVVVKVLRPGIQHTIAADIKLLHWLARVIEKHVPDSHRLRPREVVADYENIIFGELDLLAEGANATQLRRNFANSPQLYVPKIYWEHSRPGMLVMERIHGIPVADIQQLTEHGINLKKLAETGVEIFFTQVFEHSFFHADMHPGNIFVAPDKPEQPQYIAIDCAIIGSLTSADQQYLARNLLAIFKRDYRKVAELHVECGWVPPQTSVPAFESAMRAVCEPVFEKPLKEISFGFLLVQLFRTAGRFNMEVQPSLVLLQKTLLNVEGLGRQLYPELDLWTTALPFLERWNRKRMHPATVLNALKENVPDWIEQLPQLPKLWLDAMAQQGYQHKQLASISEELQQIKQQQRRMSKKRAQQSKLFGILALLGAVILALSPTYPALQSGLLDLPLSSWILGGLGAYLLCFKR